MPIVVTNTDNFVDDATRELAGAIGSTYAVVGGVTYVFVAGYSDSGISVFRLDADGTLVPVFDITDAGAAELLGVVKLKAVEIGAATYLIAVGFNDDGVSTFLVGNDGSLTLADSETDSAMRLLDNPQGLAVLTIGSRVFAYVGSDLESGMTILEIGSDGSLTFVATVADNASLEMAYTASITAVTIGGRNFVIAAGYADDGFSIFEADADGLLTHVQTVSDDASLKLDGTYGMATAEVGGTTYLVVTGYAEDGFSVFSLGADGIATPVTHFTDDAFTSLDGPVSVSAFVLGGETYLAISGAQSAINLFVLDADGSVTFSQAIDDDGTLLLGGEANNSVAYVDGRPFLIGTGYGDHGVSVFSLNATPTLTLPVFAIERVSTDSSGAQATGGNSIDPVFSPDGTKVAFDSAATNLVAGDTNGFADVFVKDLITGAVTRISTDSLGGEANGASVDAVFSPDGTKVLFASMATNLTADSDTNDDPDLFIKDLTTGAVTRVSENAAGVQGLGASYDAFFAPDGTKVVFWTNSNLIGIDNNGQNDVYVKDLITRAITRVSTDASGAQLNGASIYPRFSPDGGSVLFYSFATNLVAGDTNGVSDVFIKNLTTGAVTRVSTSAAGVQGNAASSQAIFSPDGTRIAFISDATNLVAGDTNGTSDIFVKDLATGAVTRVAPASGGGTSVSMVFSPDGTKLAFRSLSNIVSGDTNSAADVFVADLATGTITRISHDALGVIGNGPSALVDFSPDGKRLVIQSGASNLVGGDTNGRIDIFAVTLGGIAPTYTEGGAAVVLNGSATVADAELDALNGGAGDYAGATLTVARQGGADAEDAFSFDTAGALFTVSGNDLQSGGLTFATFNASGGTLTVTFTSSGTEATSALAEDVLRRVTYANGSDSPPASATIEVSLDDGDAGTSSATIDVAVTAVNDPPLSDWATVFVNEDGVATLTVSDFTQSYADPENDAFAGILVTYLPANGALLFDDDGAGGDDPVAVTVNQFIAAADIADGKLTYVPVADGFNITGAFDEFGFRAVDDGGTDNGGDDTQDDESILTFRVEGVNDAPVIDLDPSEAGSDAAASFTEGDGPLLLAPGAIFTDDNLDFDGAVLTIAFTANGTADDQLTINDMGSGPGLLGVSGSNITYDGNVVGSFTGGDNGNPLVITFNADACHCAVQLAMDNIAFSNSSDAIDGNQRTVSFTLVDGDGDANGGADTASASVTIDITPVNDAPFSDWATVFLNEDSVATLTVMDFTQSYDDPDSNFAGIVVTYLTANGQLLFDADGFGGNDPVAVTLNQYISAADIADGKLTYVPVADGFNITGGFDEFGFRAVDDGGTDNGGDDTQDEESVLTFRVEGVNDAPFLDLDYTDFTATGNNSAASWADGDAPVALAFAIELDDDDADNSYPGATVTAAFTANGTADDRLVILSVGDGLGEIRVDGSDVYYEGTLVGTFTGGTDGSTPLVVTFNADACHCAVQQTIASIAFTNASEAPDVSQRTVTITFVDGGGTDNGGADTASANVTIDVSAANDAPTAAFTLPTVPLPVGGEFTVNADTAGIQASPSIAAFEDGSYVVVWRTTQSGVSSIRGQFFSADGTPMGNEFQVNTLSDSSLRAPAVAVLEDGGFVVTWENWHASTGMNLETIQAQRFDAAGDPVDAEFQVNGGQGQRSEPAIAALEDGGWVIVWRGPGTGSDIFGQRYDVNGDPVGGEFRINTYITSAQVEPEIAGLPDGGFMVVWSSGDQDGASSGVYAQRYDADGDPAGSEFRVNTATAWDERDAHIAVLADGSFVITWLSLVGFDGDVYARHYAADGTALGADFIVRSGVSLGERNFDPRVAALTDGGFVINWRTGGGIGEINARRYDSDAAALGDSFRVNSLPNGFFSALAGLADGSFVIVWEGEQDGDISSIQAQHFAGHFAAVEQEPLDLKDRITLADVDDSGGTYTVTLSVTEGLLSIDPGTSGASVDDSDQQNIVITGTLAEIQALLGSDPNSSVSYTYHDDYLPLGTIGLSVTVDDGIDSTTEAVTIDLTPVNDAAQLDLDFFEPGNDAVATYVAGDPPTYLAFYATFDDDNADWDGATLTIAITGAASTDQLTIEDVGTGPGEISVTGNQIFYEGGLVGTFTGGVNGAPLVVTFNADACACAVEAVTYGIQYESTAPDFTPSTRDVTFTFVDGDGTANGGADTAIATVELTLQPTPTPPVIDAGAAASGDEDTLITLSDIVITDAGDLTTGLVTVRLSVEHGTLSLLPDLPGGVPVQGLISSSGNALLIVATPAQINATIAAGGLRYQGDANFNGADALSITVHDGTPDTALAITSLGAQAAGGFTGAVALYDLDGDTLDDLVMGIGDGSGIPGIIAVLAGIPSFAFLPEGGADAFAFADFDGDGDPDIGFASYDDDGSGYVGYFSSDTGDVEVIANVGAALDLVAGDFNGDTLADIAVADSDNSQIAILLQTAPGVFAPPAYLPLAAGRLTVSIRTGDFDGDGVLDLLASNYGAVTGYAPPGSVYLLLGNGDGSFAAAAEVWTGPWHADGLVVADFDGDGDDDFAFAASGTVNGVTVVLNNGDGTFDAGTSYATGGEPSRVVAGDLNGDGILDLVVVNYDDPGTFSVLVGAGDGSFQAAQEFDTGDSPFIIAIGDPDGDGDLDLVIGNAGDGTFEAFDNGSIARGSAAAKTITVNPVDDASDAIDDAGGPVAENATVEIDVRANDNDIDGAVGAVIQIEGGAATVDNWVPLASGARVSLNADGTVTYDPNGAFNSLISAATAAATGALNTSATDSFSYTLAGGSTATVTVTVTGVQSADDLLRGDGSSNAITGTSGSDIFMLDDGGDDTVSGGDGNDGFYMGASLSPGDSITGGNGGYNDALALQGDYSGGYTFSATNLIGIETLVLLSGSYTTYSGGPGTARYAYNLTTVDANVAAGQILVVNGNQLMGGEDLYFDGSAETDGSFWFQTSGGNDTLIGGDGNDVFIPMWGADTMTGGDGNDLFYYRYAAESLPTAKDHITDFTAGDRINLYGLGVAAGRILAFLGDDPFTNTPGQLRVTGSGTSWLVEVDIDGDGNPDFAIDVNTTASDYAWTTSDFLL